MENKKTHTWPLLESAVIRTIKLEKGTERERVGKAASDGWPQEASLRGDTELPAGWEGARQGDSHGRQWGEANTGPMSQVASTRYNRR